MHNHLSVLADASLKSLAVACYGYVFLLAFTKMSFVIAHVIYLQLLNVLKRVNRMDALHPEPWGAE